MNGREEKVTGGGPSTVAATAERKGKLWKGWCRCAQLPLPWVSPNLNLNLNLKLQLQLEPRPHIESLVRLR